MIKKVLGSIIIFQLISTITIAQTNRQIEIFDISKGIVIMNVQSNTDSQLEVKKFFKGITGVYVKYNPIPNKGFMVRIPIEPPVMVKNQWFNDLVDEVTIIFSGHENPYLMVFDDENRPHFLTFEGDAAHFLKLLNLKLWN
ncbi:hypothetical protein [Bacillus sp. T3]|uniref:hypothetical protein n=1 Tax=Bacillus sp. T3 TaxID=467262 RepID=UPI002981DD50|nr:hypothetical protein [Bacillus sp. T3]